MSDTKHKHPQANRNVDQLPVTRNLKRVRRQQLPFTQAAQDEYVIPVRETDDYLPLVANMLR